MGSIQIGSMSWERSGKPGRFSFFPKEDKILRLIQNEAANPCGSCGIMESPQMSRQSERSAS